MTLMRHSPAHERAMIEWLVKCSDEQRIAPSYPEIADRFNFHGVEQARTLIADLSDNGFIRLRPSGDDRFTCEIIRTTPREKSAPLHIGSLDVSLDEEIGHLTRMDMIRAAGARLRSRGVRQEARPARLPITSRRQADAAQPADLDPNTVAQLPAVIPDTATWPKCGHPKTVENTRLARHPMCRTCWQAAYEAGKQRRDERRIKTTPSLPLAHEEPLKDQQGAMQPAPQAKEPLYDCMVAFRVQPATAEWLAEHASKEPGVISRDDFAHGIFMEAMYARLALEPNRPLIRGPVLKEWQKRCKSGHDESLGDFVTRLLDVGLEAFLESEGDA